MSDNFTEDFEWMEQLSASITAEVDSEEKSMDEMRKGAVPVFLTDIRFKESMESGDLMSEEAYGDLDEEEKGAYEMIQVLDEESKEQMGWAFRFKADDDIADEESSEDQEEEEGDEDAPEEKTEESAEVAPDIDDVDEKQDDMPEVDAATMAAALISSKAAMLMARMQEMEDEKTSMFLTDPRFKEMVEDGELIEPEEYDGMDDDAKGAFEAVNVFEEGTGKGYGMRYRRRSPMELASMRKGDQEKAERAADEDMFASEEEAMERAAELGCEGTHGAGEMFMPCSTHDEWMKLSELTSEPMPEPTPAAPAPGPAVDPAHLDWDAGATMPPGKAEILCGYQRKSVETPCAFCSGGCASAEGLPGLADIEAQVKDAYIGSEVISSGYSLADDVFVVDIKREQGDYIEVFLTGAGEELGWLRISADAVEGKSETAIDIISKRDAEKKASDAISELGYKADALSVTVDVYADQDVYVVELDAEEKSFDVFVSADGKVLGYDEYEYTEPVELSEDEEIKALEAELAIKRLYSREQRLEMASNGEALEDGSFPIADEADLSNAIQALGRAADPEAAKDHIMKRAKELKLEDMIPEEWSESPAPAAAEEDMMAGPKPGEKAESDGLDAELMAALLEFEEMQIEDFG